MDKFTPTVYFENRFSVGEIETPKAALFANPKAQVDRIPAVCSEEPIYTPGTIQPHGGMLVIDPSRDWAVIAASRNIAEILGSPLVTEGLFGKNISNLLGPRFFEAVQTRFQEGRLRGEAPWQSYLSLNDSSREFDVAVHHHAGLIQLELEPVRAENQVSAQTVVRQLQEAIVALRETGSDLEELALVTARGVRLLTGYERVVVYRFDSDWNGQAIVEDAVGGWNAAWSGLRFPASDIPAQARELYRHSPTRWVADRDAVPMPLDLDPAWAGPSPPKVIDLSFALLRSLSPVHLQVHRDLGINSSMSLSVLHKDRLWGLMVCHHRQPHHPSCSQRLATVALTDAFALRVGPVEHIATEQARREDVLRLSTLLAHMAEADEVTAALTTGDVTINSLFASTGAAVIYDGDVSLLGHTPPEADIRELAAWLQTHAGPVKLFQTINLSAVLPLWKPHAVIASGLLAVFLSDDRSSMLLWFRPQEAELVSWGGSSRNKPKYSAAEPPTFSVEKWAEVRHGLARPWAEWELELGESLRHGITEVMVRSLRRIADLNDRLRQSQKMEAVGQLTGGIAHDFNNLLAGILGSLELIQTRVGQGRIGDLDRYIGVATTSANRAASLTHRLLAFSRRQTLAPQSVDVNRLATSMEDLIRRTVGPAIQVETVILESLWKTLCDANQLENALLNCAINARDAMPGGGHLTIGAANVTLDQAYASLHDTAPGQYVAVSITDTGYGMTPDVIARVFEPFFTTKPIGQGTGLGLSMVYGFAKQSNGHTCIYSEVGQGTTVRLYLPRHIEVDEIEVGSSEPPSNHTAKVKGTVLVVDDESAVRMLVGETLRDLGYDVLEAADGPEGLHILTSKNVDLLISDVGLPYGMNGRQLADAARIYCPWLKVLFITGYAESAVWDGSVRESDVQVLTKPFALDVLTTKIRAMLC